MITLLRYKIKQHCEYINDFKSAFNLAIKILEERHNLFMRA